MNSWNWADRIVHILIVHGPDFISRNYLPRIVILRFLRRNEMMTKSFWLT